MNSVIVRKSNITMKKSNDTHQISKTVKFLTKQTGTVRPARDFAIKKVEHEASERERQGLPQVRFVVRDQVPTRRENRQRPAEAIHDSDEICSPEIPAKLYSSTVRFCYTAVLGFDAHLTREKCPSELAYSCSDAFTFFSSAEALFVRCVMVRESREV